MKEFTVTRKQDPDGLCVHILHGEVRGLGELIELAERLPNLCPEGAFMRKLRVMGRRDGQRLSVMMVFEFYERAEPTPAR
jgi:hypothetical protein